MEKVMLILYFYAFIFGICIASFINVVIYRLPHKIDFIKGRSFCPNCKTSLKAIDLVPIFSWLFLKGKCRYCKEPISKRYPIIETIGGILAVLCFHHYKLSLMTFVSFAVAMLLLAITMIDFDTFTIPTELVIALIIPAILTALLVKDYSLTNRIMGMLSVSGFLFLMIIIIPGSFGGGDLKLMVVAGFLLGLQNTLLAFFIAIIIGGGYAIYVLISKQKNKKQHIAFGPYLSIGIFISLLYGSNILNWYTSLFF